MKQIKLFGTVEEAMNGRNLFVNIKLVMEHLETCFDPHDNISWRKAKLIINLKLISAFCMLGRGTFSQYYCFY